MYDSGAHMAALSSQVMAVENTYIPKRYEDYVTDPNSGNVNLEGDKTKPEGQEEENSETLPEETAEETEAETIQEETAEETEIIERESEATSPPAEEIEATSVEHQTENTESEESNMIME